MFPTIETLAADIDDAWSRVGYADDDFCAIAAEHLDRPLGVDFAAVARRVCGAPHLPPQRRSDQAFGQPGLTLFHGPRFTIEALCWHNGTPAIHEHSFSGAFRVLTGRSVHSRYWFNERVRIGEIVLGDLTLERIELLDSTAIIQIPRGRGLIHSAFHLDSPTMTIVARTHQTNQPEYTFLPPGVAYDTAIRSASLHKRLQLLDTLNITCHESHHDCVCAAIESSDLYDGMAIIMRAGSHRVDEPTYLGYLKRISDRHGPRIETLVAALVEERRRGIIARLRATVTDESVRFFMACLLSFSCREDILNAMVQHYGNAEAARQHIAQGVSRMLGGAPDKQLVVTLAMTAMLNNIPVQSFSGHAARVWDRALTQDESVNITSFYEKLMQHPLLAPLTNRARE